MADKKFSDFTSEGNLSQYTGLVGYDTNNNYFITPAELNTSLESTLDLSNFNTGTLPAARGGTGITNFSDANFANANVNYASDGTGILPFAKGGTGVSTFPSSGFVTTGGSSFSVTSSINLASSDVSNTLPISKGGTNAITQADALDNITDANNQNEFDILSVREDPLNPGTNVSVFRKQTPALQLKISGQSGLFNTNNSAYYVIPYNSTTVNDDTTIYNPIISGGANVQGVVQILETGRYAFQVRYSSYDLVQNNPTPDVNKFMRLAIATDTVPTGSSWTIQCIFQNLIVPTTVLGEATISGSGIMDVTANTYLKFLFFHNGASGTNPPNTGYPVYNNTQFNEPMLWLQKVA